MSFSSSKVSKDINNMWCLVIPIFATALFYITDHPPPSMAQITARGTLKALFDRDGGRGGVRMRTEQKGDKYLLRNKLRARSHASRLLSSSSSSAATSVQGSSSQRTESNEAAAADDDDGVYEVCYEEFDKDGLDCFSGLVLDVSYRPINVVCWRRAICLEFLDKADVLEYYDQTVNSPSGSFYIPAVLRIPHLLTVVKRRRVKNTLGRKNILYRDNHTCQYCSSRENLTVDHVLPIARGGAWKWENLVTACSRCNSRKGQKTVEEANMKLMKAPKPPKDFDIVAIPLTTKAIRTLRMRKGTPEEWHQYLSMPSAEP